MRVLRALRLRFACRHANAGGHRLLYGDYIIGPTEVPAQDPCPFGLPQILTVVHTVSVLYDSVMKRRDLLGPLEWTPNPTRKPLYTARVHVKGPSQCPWMHGLPVPGFGCQISVGLICTTCEVSETFLFSAFS